MDVVRKIRDKARQYYKTIILPEKSEARVIKAKEIIEKEKIAKIILLGREDLLNEKIEEFSKTYYELRRHKGISVEDARKTVSSPLYYAAMMVKHNEADGFVAGASHSTPDVARAAIYCLGVDKNIKVASSCFIMLVPGVSCGEQGVLFFADCGIVPEPTFEQLAQIAISTSQLASNLLAITPKVALLSYSTKGSAKGRFVNKVKEATSLVKQKYPNLIVDGELQADAAIVPEVAVIKNPGGIIKGKANVLIFPDLEAGNISYKLVQRLAKARAIGPILQGLNKPCSDLSRGCSVEDIIDCVAITAIRAEDLKGSL